MRGWALGIGILAWGCLLGGCGSKAPAVWPEITRLEPPYEPAEGSQRTFDRYVRAARRAESDAPELVQRVSFTPGQKQAALRKLQPAIQLLRPVEAIPSRFEFRVYDPLRPPPHHRGWRLLGRALAWQIEAQLESGRTTAAVETLLIATRFGFDLTAGSALDAQLGLTIVNEARDALAPALRSLGAGDLTRLIQGIARLHGQRPDWQTMITHEREMMLAAVQSVQNALKSDDWEAIESAMGTDAREAIGWIRTRKNEDAERIGFFEKWVGEAEIETRALQTGFDQPRAQRQEMPTFEGETRPWRRFARHFFRTARPLLAQNDLTTARTRLLLAEAYVLRSIKLKQRSPRDLGELSMAIRTDPYSGEPLIYRTQGLDYKLYSVGENLRDDSGETDESGTTPDLVLLSGSAGP
ncbi:MAG TPA: hypothetical protein PLO61_08305 [Fimbriimonadaceae bacterium]|nr:hypothetical protein [Fimbriimonadaceae bacterium]HRJ33596.1 hypothetical protein [Fimbriimonadaceae bacterium]